MKIVNLNKARKARKRADAKTEANANAVKFGRTKAEKNLDRAKSDKAARDLDQHRRED